MIIKPNINGDAGTAEEVFGLTTERVAELETLVSGIWNNTATEMLTIQEVAATGLTAEELCYCMFSVGLQSGYHYANREKQ